MLTKSLNYAYDFLLSTDAVVRFFINHLQAEHKMEDKSTLESRILSIHYMRGIAALLVVFFHFRFMLNNRYEIKNLGEIFAFGGFGVDLFFMISGFIICYATNKESSIINFITKRIFRIIPVYWFALLVLLVFSPAINLGMDFIKSAFLIQRDYSSGGPFFGYSTLVTAWTLSYEFAFYLLFMISMLISHRYRSYICSALILSTILITQFIYNGSVSYSGYVTASTGNAVIKLYSSPMMLEFVIGMLVYEFYKFEWSIIHNKHFKYIIGVAFWIAVSYAIGCYLSGHSKGHGLQGYGFPSLMLFFTFVIYEKANGLKFSQVLSSLGDWSYSIYISHFIILSLVPHVDLTLTIFRTSYGASKFVFLTLVTLVISKVMFETIEKPCSSLGRKLIKLLKSRRVYATN